jgi:putative transposase
MTSVRGTTENYLVRKRTLRLNLGNGFGWGRRACAPHLSHSPPHLLPWHMPNYRRPFVPGGTFFFTVTTNGRQPVLTEPVILAGLRDAVRETRRGLPFTILAWVVLPDHVHAIWELPPGDADYSLRWARIKQAVTRVYIELPFAREIRSPSRTKRREGTLWQRRFWEHQIRDEIDLVRHVE